MNRKTKRWPIIIVFFVISLLFTFSIAYAEEIDDNSISELTIEFYDSEMQMTDEFYCYEFTNNYIDYVYPVSAEYMRVIVRPSYPDYDIKVDVNGEAYGEQLYYDISAENQYYVDITISDEEGNANEYTVQLNRNTEPRDSSILEIEWVVLDENDVTHYPESIVLSQDGSVIPVEVPYTAQGITFEYFYTANNFSDVSVIVNASEVYQGYVEIDVGRQDTNTVVVSSQIDGASSVYYLELTKVEEPCSVNSAEGFTVWMYDVEGDYVDNIDITCSDSLEYEVKLPDDIAYFEVDTYCSHVMATVKYESESIVQDLYLSEWGGLAYKLINNTSVYITVTAENGNTQNYTLNITKEGSTAQPAAVQTTVEPVSTAPNNSSTVSIWVWISIIAAAIIVVALVIIFAARKKKSKLN